MREPAAHPQNTAQLIAVYCGLFVGPIPISLSIGRGLDISLSHVLAGAMETTTVPRLDAVFQLADLDFSLKRTTDKTGSPSLGTRAQVHSNFASGLSLG